MFDVSRWVKPLLSAASILFVCSGLTVPHASAQSRPSISEIPLPNVPQPARFSSSSEPSDSQQSGTGTLTGTVLDTNKDVLQGARITLTAPSDSATQTTQSGINGQFSFTGLKPDIYRLTVTAPGMKTFTSPQIPLQPGETRIVPPVALAVFGGATSVTVTGNEEQLSREQVQIAVQQRIGRVIPNFYSTYDWNAPPMLAKQKVDLSLRSIFDPVAFFTVAGLAGAEQYKNVFPAYGSGFEGYSKRYGAAFANHASGILLGRAVYPAIFHQDPRYFYKGKGSIGSRALYAVSAAVIARGDNGQWQPNYSRLLGNFSAAAISNLYYPRADRGASLVLLNGLAGTGADAAANLIREFLLKRITSHVPKAGAGEP